MSALEKPKPASFVGAEAGSFRYVEKTNPQSSNLNLLTYGVYELSGAVSTGRLAHPDEEALLFCWKGGAEVECVGRKFSLERYDVLYVPRGATYRLTQGAGESKLIVCRAPA